MKTNVYNSDGQFLGSCDVVQAVTIHQHHIDTMERQEHPEFGEVLVLYVDEKSAWSNPKSLSKAQEAHALITGEK